MISPTLACVTTTHAATAAAVLFTAPSLPPSAEARAQGVHAADVLVAIPDGGDPLRLRPQPPPTRRTNAARLVQALAALPRHSVVLTGGIPGTTCPMNALADAY
ncbi:hypothetical protein OG900_09395 [Streptomyces sp. NBC_00433]